MWSSIIPETTAEQQKLTNPGLLPGRGSCADAQRRHKLFLSFFLKACLSAPFPRTVCSSNPMQEILEVVRSSAADFDAVCMATALHKMASLDADPQQYQQLADKPELTRLKDLICKLHMLELSLLHIWSSLSASMLSMQVLSSTLCLAHAVVSLSVFASVLSVHMW